MRTRQPFVFGLAFVVLLFGAPACASLGSGSGPGAPATVTAAPPTDANDNPTAGAIVRSTRAAQATRDAQATRNTLATEATRPTVPTSSATPDFISTQFASINQTQDAIRASVSSVTPSAAAGGSSGPSDIPILQFEITLVHASPDEVDYLTKADRAVVVSFYQAAMPKNGWTADASDTVETPNATVLAFTKGSRHADVSIRKDAASGRTQVAIAIH